MSDTPNAADRRQVEHASRKEKDKRARLADTWKHILATPEGREIIGEILAHCGTRPYREPVHVRGDEQQRLIGMQRVGGEIVNTIMEVDARALLKIDAERLERELRDQVEAAAVRTRAATERVS